MSFTIETEQSIKISFLHANIIVKGVNLQQVSIENQLLVVRTLILLANIYKIGIIYTFVNRCFRIC